MGKVLLIDDDQIILDFLESLLTVKGHRSIKALEGEEGLRLAAEHTPDLVITDLNLPKVTGWKVIKQLKTEEATKSIPILAVSAHNTSHDRDAAHDAGCNAYLSKPLDPAALIDAVDKILKS